MNVVLSAAGVNSTLTKRLRDCNRQGHLTFNLVAFLNEALLRKTREAMYKG